jgi:hypothetical protein
LDASPQDGAFGSYVELCSQGEPHAAGLGVRFRRAALSQGCLLSLPELALKSVDFAVAFVRGHDRDVACDRAGQHLADIPVTGVLQELRGTVLQILTVEEARVESPYGRTVEGGWSHLHTQNFVVRAGSVKDIGEEGAVSEVSGSENMI